MLLVGVNLLSLRNLASNIIRITELGEVLSMRCLEVIVDESSLLLLAQSEVMRLELGLQICIGCLLHYLARLARHLLNILLLGFSIQRRALAIVADRHACFLHLVANTSPVSCQSTMPSLLVDLRSV